VFAKICSVIVIWGIVCFGVDIAGHKPSTREVASVKESPARGETEVVPESSKAEEKSPKKAKVPENPKPLKIPAEGCGREDPFAPLDVEKPEKPQEPLREESPEFRLNGIIWSENQPLAIVNDTIVGVGDVIKDAEVIEIKKREVILKRDEQTLILKFKTLILFRVKGRPMYASREDRRESSVESREWKTVKCRESGVASKRLFKLQTLDTRLLTHDSYPGELTFPGEGLRPFCPWVFPTRPLIYGALLWTR